MTPWNVGMAVEGPVYLDANVVVGGLVHSQALYKASARLLGELIANKTPILLSDVVLSEALWAMAKVAYCDLMNQWNRARWNKEIFQRHHAAIFARQGAKIAAAPNWILSLANAGYPIDVVRSTQPQWLRVVDQTHAFMRDFRLTTNDAIHLALAAAHARTFITADRRDYASVVGQGAPAGLAMLQLDPI
jgi:predicted nucleic acid-binding protein